MINTPLLKYKTRKINRYNLSVRNSVKYSAATSIGILFTVEDLSKHNAIKELVQSLKDEGKQVTVLSLLPNGKDNFEFKFDYFSASEFSYMGSINNEAVHSFVAQPFDFLFHLDSEVHILNNYILAKSHARCRVGNLQEEKSEYFELMVKPLGKGIKELIDLQFNYIKKIQ